MPDGTPSKPDGTYQVCPFTYMWWRDITCAESCGYLFPKWKEEVQFTPDGNIQDMTMHPCEVLGNDVVMATMKEKFPELY